jgi:hypothetical protein
MEFFDCMIDDRLPCHDQWIHRHHSHGQSIFEHVSGKDRGDSQSHSSMLEARIEQLFL